MKEKATYESLKDKLIALDAPIEPTGTLKLGAVLVPIFPSSDRIMFTKRSNSVKNHPGQISFPGGAVENDETVLEACLRETYEEVGIEADKIHLLGRLKPLETVSKFFVYPIVGLVKENIRIKINPDEVEKVFFVKIQDLLSSRKKSSMQEDGFYFTSFTTEDYTIWGVTAEILVRLFSKLE